MIRTLVLLGIFFAAWAAETNASNSASPVPASVTASGIPGTVMSSYAAEYFQKKVHPIFVEHCHECHANGRSKGGLSIATLHDFLEGGNEGIVLIPGDITKSALIPSIRWEAHDEELNMPPKKRLSDDEVATLTKWVDMGAPWPLSNAAMPAESTPIPKSKPPLIGRVHPVIVHFPIACLLLAVLAESLVVMRGNTWRPVTAFLLIIGTTAALAAVISGTWLAEDMTAAVERHQIVGWVTLISATVTCGLLFIGRRWPLRIALIVTAAAAGLAGHLGGDLVYGQGWIL